MNKLQIIKDVNIVDKYRDSFVKALVNECLSTSTEYEIITNINQVEWDLPCVVTEPHTLDIPSFYNDMDKHTTARVITSLTGKLKPTTVLVINRSELIGKPLVNMLLEQDHTVTIAHSKTSPEQLKKLAKASGVLIAATGHKLDLGNIYNIMTIDVSRDLTNCNINSLEHYNMSAIGKLTVKRIVGNVKNS